MIAGAWTSLVQLSQAENGILEIVGPGDCGQLGMTRDELTQRLKSEAIALGFTLSGVCRAIEPTGMPRLTEWLERGYAGQMGYLSARQDAYSHPRHVLEGARSVVMLGLPYATVAPATTKPGQGRISRYAWGSGDYHDVIRAKLKALIAMLQKLEPQAQLRGVVDTAPLLEREYAQLAGLGWIGKNTLLINKPLGSYFFLAALLTDLELAYDEPFAAEHCGTCRACLDACPTNAFPQPYVLDATRCISYLTIELRDHVPAELRPGIGDWLFGCDVCQDVCPWNHRAPRSDEPAFQPEPGANPVELVALFEMDDDAFRARFRHAPLWRARRRGVLRTAAIVLGNQRAREAVPALIRGLSDGEPLIRGACAWALGQIGGPQATGSLLAHLPDEPDAIVREEVESALHVAS
jgi:epoxyqueuosine reductase